MSSIIHDTPWYIHLFSYKYNLFVLTKLSPLQWLMRKKVARPSAG